MLIVMVNNHYFAVIVVNWFSSLILNNLSILIKDTEIVLQY